MIVCVIIYFIVHNLMIERSWENFSWLLLMVLMLFFGTYDAFLASSGHAWKGSDFYLSLFNGFFYSLAFLITFGSRAVRAFSALGSANATLELRIAQTREELAASEAARQTLVVGMDRHSGAIPPQREPATVADALLGATQEAASKSSLRYSMAVRLVSTVDASVTATLGAERAHLVRERLGSKATLIGTGSGLTALYDERVTNSGVFGQLKVDIRNTVFLSAGLREERNSNFGQNVAKAYSPMLGIAITRDVGEATIKTRAAYGKGIRPPAPSMRQAIRTLTFRQLANPELAPEEQAGSEAGVELYIGDRLNLSFTAYSQNAEGLIQQVVSNPLERARTIQYQNVGRIQNRGIEVEASTHLGALRGDVVYSFTDSRVRRLSPTYTGDLSVGDRVPEVPLASGLASLTLERGRARATLGASYIGPWIGYDWLDYYAGELGSRASKPLLRNYWMQYPSLTKPFVGVGVALGRSAEWYLRVDNLSNLQRYERDDLQITAGRTMTVGLRVVR